LEALQREAAKAIPQYVIAEGSVGADPALQSRLREFCFQLLKTGRRKTKPWKAARKTATGEIWGATRESVRAATAVRKSKTLVR
jgi:hypothetical protein